MNPFSTRVVRTLGAVLLTVLAFSAPAGAQEATPPAAAKDETPRTFVLRIYGSPTIGTRLAGSLLEDFLKAEGWTDVRRLPAAEGSTYAVAGRAPGSEGIAGVHVGICDAASAFQAFEQGFADVVMSTRPVLPAEAARLSRFGDLTSAACEHPIALDALALIVNPVNPVNALSKAQLREIYLRQLVTWPEGGPAGAIHPFARGDESGATALFRAVIAGGTELPAQVERFPDDGAIAQAVARDARGIGLVALPFVGANRILAIAGGSPSDRPIVPGEAFIRSGEYPLSRKLFLYQAARPDNALAEKFVRFATGGVGQDIVARSGFLPLVPPLPATTPQPAPTPAPSLHPIPAEAAPTPRVPARPAPTRAPTAAPKAPAATPVPPVKPTPGRPRVTPVRPGEEPARSGSETGG